MQHEGKEAMAFGLMEFTGTHKGAPILTAPTLAEAMVMAKARLPIVLMEKDPDGHEAADIFTAHGAIYVIERV